MPSSFLSDWKKWPLKVPSSQLYYSILWTGTISLVEGHSVLLKIVFLLLPLWTAYRKRANIQILFTHVRFHQRTHWGGHFGGKHQQNLNCFPKWSLKSVYRSVCLHRDKTHPTWKHRWEPTEPYQDGVSLQTQTDHQCQNCRNPISTCLSLTKQILYWWETEAQKVWIEMNPDFPRGIYFTDAS